MQCDGVPSSVKSPLFSQFTRKSVHNCNVANRRKIKMSASSAALSRPDIVEFAGELGGTI